MNQYSPHLTLAHTYWANHLVKPCTAIDATCGNGHDSLVLAQLLQTHPPSVLIGIDIQQQAIQQTQFLFYEKNLPITLYQMCHSNIDLISLETPPQLIVYNLGYLPRTNKMITTQTTTTLISLKKAIKLLAPNGAISITCYPGHAEGAREERAIVQWVEELSKKEWVVQHHRWTPPLSPSLLWIAKC